jgi:glycosyltransferase involved in cell wall biosynthesis
VSHLVSVVIPTFNRLPFLREAVESCLSQSHSEIEIIVVDDGSTDDTSSFFTGRVPLGWNDRVKYFRQESSGASAARNDGVRRASGVYVQFLDSDDLLLKNKIALQVDQLAQPASAKEVCSCYGRLVRAAVSTDESVRIGIQRATPADYIRQMCGSTIHGMSTCAPLWSREFLMAQKGWSADISMGDDLEYYIRLLTQVSRVDFVDRELFIVREHAGPRLSDASGNRGRVKSAVTAHQRIVDSVCSAGLCSEAAEVGLSRKARTLYANTLACGTPGDVDEFEAWFRQTWRGKRGAGALSLAVMGRQVVGQRMMSAAIERLLRVKGRLAGVG